MTISGSGPMADYATEADIPWYSSRNDIKTVVVSNGVSGIGECAFHDCSSLTSITIPNSVTSIGNHAFSSYSARYTTITFEGPSVSTTTLGPLWLWRVM